MNREFSLQSLLLHAKLNKRALFLILAAAIVLSLLVGLMLGSRVPEATVNETYQAELTQFEIDQEMLTQSVHYNRDLIEGINRYFANSLLVKENLLSAEAYQFQVQINAPSTSVEGLAARYAGFAKDKALLEAVRAEANLQAPDHALAELIEVYFDQETQRLVINARHPDAAKKQALAQRVLDYLKAQGELSITDSHALIVSELGLVSTLYSPLNLKVNELVLQRDEAKNQLDQRQKALDSLVPPSEMQVEMNQTPLLKYLVLGILLGLALVIMYLVYKSNTKDARVLISDLKEYYNLPVLFALRDQRSVLEKNQVLFLEEAPAQEHFESMLALLEEERILVVGESALLKGVDNKKLAFIDKLDKDNVAILKQADAVLLSMHPYDISHTQLQQLLSLITLSGKKVLGVVIN